MFDSADASYEVRYGWTLKAAVLASGSLVFCTGPLILSGHTWARVDGLPVPIWLIDVLSVLLGVTGLLLTLTGPLTRRRALRVDATGIVLGGNPLRYAATTLTVPWSEITAVELWVQRMRVNGRTIRTPYIGIHRTETATPRPGLSARAGTGVTGKSAALIAASRPVNLWHLDQPSLRKALAAHAPGVRLHVEADFGA
ncbi:hypothetical protein ABT095_28380 [Kitasatospora sp. NPDC002227]|uniref:hypothetical protein n=1 Tax=Kitasatospora sp. NPDC002227 TaxID=3154773 RepID=UPI00332C872B